MIILYNLSKTNKLTFDFGAANLALGSYGLMCGDEFTIEPMHGNLDPT